MKSWHSQCCFINLSSATVLFFPAIHRFLYFRFCICRLKSIKIDQSRSKSIIIEQSRKSQEIVWSTFIDWFVSTTIDNNRILLTIRIIDMLRPEIRWNHWLRCFLGKEFLLFCSLSGSHPSIVLILANTFLIRPTQAVLASHGAIKDYPGNLSQSKSTAGFPPFSLSKLILALPSLPHIYLSHWPPVRGYLLPLPRSRVLDVTQLSPALRDIHKTAARETCTLVNLNLFPQT